MDLEERIQEKWQEVLRLERQLSKQAALLQAMRERFDAAREEMMALIKQRGERNGNP